MRGLINRRRQSGIGLLELMLSLAIIAILLIMATRYYQSASESNKINQAVDMFSAINGAVQNYKLDSDPLGVNVAALTDGGYLPPNYGSGTVNNPWGGSVQVAVSGTTVTITMEGVPPSSSPKVTNRVDQTIARASTGSSLGATDGTLGTVVAVYSL